MMHVNNEIGTVQRHCRQWRGDAICRQHGVLLHVDAAQSAGKVGDRPGANCRSI
jgi:cysteine sulfinate desulfinase/cysteine desulfurase-like protein